MTSMAPTPPAELAFPFLRTGRRPPKPRTRGITEIRGPYYSVMGPRYLKDVLGTKESHMPNMVHPHTQPDRAQTPQDHAPSARLTVVSDPEPTSVDDSGLGLTLFVVFVTSVLLITGAVAFLALFTAWWVLGLVFALDLLVTGALGTVIFTVLGDGKLRHKGEDRGQLEAATDLEPTVRTRARPDRTSPVAA